MERFLQNRLTRILLFFCLYFYILFQVGDCYYNKRVSELFWQPVEEQMAAVVKEAKAYCMAKAISLSEEDPKLREANKKLAQQKLKDYNEAMEKYRGLYNRAIKENAQMLRLALLIPDDSSSPTYADFICVKDAE